MSKEIVKSSRTGKSGGKFVQTTELCIAKSVRMKRDKITDLLKLDLDQKLQLSEVDLIETNSSSTSPSHELRLEISHSLNEYGASSESLKHQLKTEVLSALKLHLNPGRDLPIVQTMTCGDWSHCFNKVYTQKLTQKLSDSVYRLNGCVQTHFNEKTVKTLSIRDQYVFNKHKDDLKLTIEHEIMEIRKVLHVAVGEFLGVVEHCEGLSCAESFSKLCLSEFRSCATKSVAASGGDLLAVSNLYEATKSVVPLLNTGNKRYNQNYLEKRIAEVPAKEKELESTIIRKRAASAVTVERRSDAAAVVAVNKSVASVRERVSKCTSLSNMTVPATSVDKPKKARRVPADIVSPPPRNSESVDKDIDKLFERKEYFHEVSRSKRPSGDLKQHCMLLSKKVMYAFGDCVDGNETATEENIMIYLHYVLCDAADEIFNSVYDEKLANPYEMFTPLHNNSEKPSQNDYMRRSANASYSNNSRLRNVIENIKYMLLQDKVINLQTFFTSGSGEEFSITLLLALLSCKRQQDHFDFDPVLYAPHEVYEDVDDNNIGTYLNFNGASLFINFDWFEWQSLDLDEIDLDPKAGKDEFRKLWMRPMSILVINGNLKHAGSANKSGKVIRKFFLYLDPCGTSRRDAVLREQENCSSKKSKEKLGNYIFFDQYSKIAE
jgi:hypothetical protein